MHASNLDAVRGLPSWPAIEIILLNINPVLGDSVEGDVLVGDVLDTSCRSTVGFDTTTVLAISNMTVGERHRVDRVVALATH